MAAFTGFEVHGADGEAAFGATLAALGLKVLSAS